MRPGAVVVDLEDSVHPLRLEFARLQAVEALAAVGDADIGRVVRVHAAGHAAQGDDLNSVVGPRLDAVMLPKVDSAADSHELEVRLGELESARGLPLGGIGIVPVVESCLGLRYVFEIAMASERVAAMSFASAEEADFMADLGGRWTPGGLALQYPRSRFVCDVRAAGHVAAIDGPCMQLDDPAELEGECAAARTLGFDGKVAIHPSQLEILDRAFTPSLEEVQAAEATLAEAASAESRAVGVAGYDGRMIDAANARTARRTLDRAVSRSRSTRHRKATVARRTRRRPRILAAGK